MNIPDDAGEILSVILSRRSCRRFADESISQKTVELLIKAGEAAPSAHDSRPWKFEIMSEARLLMMNDRLNGIANDIKAEKGTARAKLAILTRYSTKIMEEAAAVIAVFNANMLKESFQGQNDVFLENYLELMEAQSTAAAMQNILLAAHAIGLGAVWLGTPVYFAEQIAKALQTPHKPMGFIAVGRPLFPKQPG